MARSDLLFEGFEAGWLSIRCALTSPEVVIQRSVEEHWNLVVSTRGNKGCIDRYVHEAERPARLHAGGKALWIDFVLYEFGCGRPPASLTLVAFSPQQPPVLSCRHMGGIYQ